MVERDLIPNWEPGLTLMTILSEEPLDKLL